MMHFKIIGEIGNNNHGSHKISGKDGILQIRVQMILFFYEMGILIAQNHRTLFEENTQFEDSKSLEWLSRGLKN